VIECVCGNGDALKPHYIFKGKRLQSTWVEDDPTGGSYSVTSNGWTDNELAVEWFDKVFDAQTRRHWDKGLHRLLILDGHGSHVSYTFVNRARELGIVLLCLPAHATNILQPLDVVIFATLSTYWTQELDKNLVGGLIMRKQDFCR